MGPVELLHRDHLAIRALLLQLRSEGLCTAEGVRTLSSEWYSHVEHLEATVAEAAPSARAAVRDLLDESGEVRCDVTARLETMTSGRAEAAVIATIAPAARVDPVGTVFGTRDRTRL